MIKSHIIKKSFFVYNSKLKQFFFNKMSNKITNSLRKIIIGPSILSADFANL
jgi:hypothetical protein